MYNVMVERQLVCVICVILWLSSSTQLHRFLFIKCYLFLTSVFL